MADLSRYSMSETGVLTLVTPDKKPTDVKIELYNKHTTRYQKARSEVFADVFAEKSTGKESDNDQDSFIDHLARLMAKCTNSWENIEWEGEELDFSEEEAIKLYKDPEYRWILDQVDEFVHRGDNFLGKLKRG